MRICTGRYLFNGKEYIYIFFSQIRAQVASIAVAACTFLKVKRLRNCVKDIPGSFLHTLRGCVYGMRKNCDSQPKEG